MAVVGASTYLGRRILEALERDPSVERTLAIDMAPSGGFGKKATVHDVDLTAPSAQESLSSIFAADRPSVVVHVAFTEAPTHALTWAHELEAVGTRHVAVASRGAGVSKLVLWSQTWLYGAHPSNPNFLTERHRLRAPEDDPFFADKLAAETEFQKVATGPSETVVTVLRTAPILGPGVDNVFTRFLSRRFLFTMMGFDPLIQVLHEDDAVQAFHKAITTDLPGTFNIAAEGVLPLSHIIRLVGRNAVPVPHPVAEAFTALGWMAQVAPVPPSFLKYLRFLCVVETEKARHEMGFEPTHSTLETVLHFASAQRFRDLRLLQEKTV